MLCLSQLILPGHTYCPLFKFTPLLCYLPQHLQVAGLMASSLPESAPTRRLFELLEEKQEPFILEVYLLEKGYSGKIAISDARSFSWIGDYCRKLQKLGSYALKKRREGIRASMQLRSVLSNLLSGKDSNTSSCDQNLSHNDERLSHSSHYTEKDKDTGFNQFSSASSRTAFSSCSSSNSFFSSAENLRPLELYNSKKQAAADRKLQWGCIEDTRQFSPVSVLELCSSEGSPGHNQTEFCQRTGNGEIPKALNFNPPNEAFEDSILSASLWDLLGFGSSDRVKSKRALQQTRKLLFNCVREVVESYAGKEGRWHHGNEYLGPEKLRKIVYDQIISWGKQVGNETNITQMLDSDFSESRQQWKHFQPQIKEIGIEIGDAILYEIKDEIVADMLSLIY